MSALDVLMLVCQGIVVVCGLVVIGLEISTSRRLSRTKARQDRLEAKLDARLRRGESK